MQRIQPKVKALQNKYKGKSDPDAKKQQQAELMALYKEHNVNPFASCLPMVFQMPVFIGLYQTLRNFHPTQRRRLPRHQRHLRAAEPDRRRHRGA